MRIGSQLIASMLFSADTDCFKGGGKGLVRRASRKGEGRRKGSRREGEKEKRSWGSGDWAEEVRGSKV